MWIFLSCRAELPVSATCFSGTIHSSSTLQDRHSSCTHQFRQFDPLCNFGPLLRSVRPDCRSDLQPWCSPRWFHHILIDWSGFSFSYLLISFEILVQSCIFEAVLILLHVSWYVTLCSYNAAISHHVASHSLSAHRELWVLLIGWEFLCLCLLFEDQNTLSLFLSFVCSSYTNGENRARVSTIEFSTSTSIVLSSFCPLVLKISFHCSCTLLLVSTAKQVHHQHWSLRSMTPIWLLLVSLPQPRHAA